MYKKSKIIATVLTVMCLSACVTSCSSSNSSQPVSTVVKEEGVKDAGTESSNTENSKSIADTVYTVGEDLEAGKYLFECTSSKYGLKLICFKSTTEYSNFDSSDKFTNGEFGEATEKNALYDFYLNEGETIFVSLSEGNIVFVHSGDGDFKKVDSLDNTKLYPGLYFIGTDIPEGKHTFDFDSAKYGTVTLVSFKDIDHYTSYHKASRFTVGEESDALEKNSDEIKYIYKGVSDTLNLKKDGILIIKDGTVSMQ